MAHTVVPEAEALLDREIKVLDKGFVRLVDYMGGDQRIVQAARVSYGEGTKTVRQDRGLINYLVRNAHSSPLEQTVLTFHIKLPIFVARQMVRHRTARLNELSGRYSVMRDEFYIPDRERMQKQSTDNKQGSSSELVEDPDRWVESLAASTEAAYKGYMEMVDSGLAREVARVGLPLNLYTEWYWQIDLHNLFHFLRLRLDGHAQYEIRVYAEAMAECAKAVAPLAYEAFEEHILGSNTFSRAEGEALVRMMEGEPHGLEGRAAEAFESKLARMSKTA